MQSNGEEEQPCSIYSLDPTPARVVSLPSSFTCELICRFPDDPPRWDESPGIEQINTFLTVKNRQRTFLALLGEPSCANSGRILRHNKYSFTFLTIAHRLSIYQLVKDQAFPVPFFCFDIVESDMIELDYTDQMSPGTMCFSPCGRYIAVSVSNAAIETDWYNSVAVVIDLENEMYSIIQMQRRLAAIRLIEPREPIKEGTLIIIE